MCKSHWRLVLYKPLSGRAGFSNSNGALSHITFCAYDSLVIAYGQTAATVSQPNNNTNKDIYILFEFRSILKWENIFICKIASYVDEVWAVRPLYAQQRANTRSKLKTDATQPIFFRRFCSRVELTTTYARHFTDEIEYALPFILFDLDKDSRSGVTDAHTCLAAVMVSNDIQKREPERSINWNENFEQ